MQEAPKSEALGDDTPPHETAPHETSPPEGLAALHFMIGRWRIQGTQHGEPVRGHAEARTIIGGDFIEYRETILNAAGEIDYEDLCLYGFDQKKLDLFVHHFSSPGHHAYHPVLPIDEGAYNWVPKGMEGPWVRLIPGPPWRVEVWVLDAKEPEVRLEFLPIEAL